MCGITGVVDLRGRRDFAEALIRAMNATQHHRGPDEDGLWRGPGVALGHKRLSIIDLSTGQQPMLSQDENFILVYNGEVYNFMDLRAQLEALGRRFVTNSDTEVVLNAYAEWGEQAVRRLRGMFAFAIWDRKKEELFIARDHVGIKPLYYGVLPDGTFIFGSELKSLLAYPELPRVVRTDAVEEYLHFGYVPEPKSIFENVFKLSPGHSLKVTRGQPVGTPREFWDIPFAPTSRGSEADIAHELIERFRESVKIRLVSEVPLGAFLSGGVDSSGVVAMMAGISADPVSTCSIAFGEREFNEADYAAKLAQRYKTAHRVRQVDPNDFALVDQLAALYDEPYADSSALPTYRVCELARERVTVALSGDGGDENLGGYRRYQMYLRKEAQRQRVPLSLRRRLVGPGASLFPNPMRFPRVQRVRSMISRAGMDPVEAYAELLTCMSETLRDSCYTPEFKRRLGGYHAREVLKRHARRAPTRDPLSLIQYLDMKTYLVGDILTKVDRASMAHSLEVRVPLLDHEFVSWSSGLTTDLKIRGTEGKYILKKALEPHVSDDILYRPKMGFGVPLAKWFRGPLRARVRETLLGERLTSMGIFERKALATLLDVHDSGRRDYSASIWTLMMLESFQRQVVEAA